ncbi:MAG: mechanosensitive ion channel [Bacteroidales bacterium]|nr:mechanosensitive ion channel [Bacteroidales bacterium]
MIQSDLYPLDLNTVKPDSIPSVQEEIEMLKSMPLDEFFDKAISSVVTFTINLTIAVVVFYVGKFIINKINHVLATILVRRQVDKSLTTFVLSLVKMVLYFLLIVTVIGILGIETSSFIALFASAGVAIGMALSGTLQNFAGGVLILLIKPYKVGDYIEAQGYAGTVQEIQIFHTIIVTPDNKSIIIPNGGLSTGSVNNYSREDYRRVDWTIAISYGDNVDAARKAILDIFASDSRLVKQYVEDDRRERAIAAEEALHDSLVELPQESHNFLWRLVHKRQRRMRDRISDWQNNELAKTMRMVPKVDRSPVVWVSELADSSVNLSARAWTRNEYYWGVFFELNERFYNELPQHGINFPFPQLDVHLPSQQ